MTVVLIRSGDQGTGAPREDCVKTREKTGIHEPRSEASEEADPIDAFISNFQNREKINIHCLNHVVCVIILALENE